MLDIEKLGVFYLGRESDPSGKDLGAPILYDSRDLVTHAVCVGMTGSGKTGLCLAIVEEAAIDGVPVIAIDPKGDLANVMLTFPGLAPEDFRPWIDEDEARRAGMAPEAFAAQQAELWRKGLADWDQDGARIERLRRSAEFCVYTPGSRAGLPLSILSSLSAPPPAVRNDNEALAERASAVATSMLTLSGIDPDPRGRPHTLLATIFTRAWNAGTTLDFSAVIQQIQNPPFQRMGVIELESFYPAKDRFALAMELNSLVASPGFEQWLEGEPLDPAALFYGANGKPKVSIVSIAHLDDTERMFVVSLLLNEIVGWMRAQSGTTSLRAIVYMDEIAGYFPPVASPPSKPPLLTMLKQARAFGVGVLLATQNTVDLDYKGLANAGTWFLGRLQTERDKARVLDGLEGAAAGSLDRASADQILSALGKRVFLLHDVHEAAPRTFQTRWTMSYLRGPLSREQIRRLTAPLMATDTTSAGKTEVTVAAAANAGPVSGAGTGERVSHGGREAATSAPVLPPEVRQYFVPTAVAAPPYSPVALGVARVTFSDSKLKVNESKDVVASAPIRDGAIAVDWSSARILDVTGAALESTPAEGASFAPLPRAASVPRNYSSWQKSFVSWIARTARLELWRHRSLQLTSSPGESERDFRIRVQNAQREARDSEVDDMRQRFAEKRARLEQKLQRAEQGVAREQGQVSQQRMQTAVSIGATMIGALFGRRMLSSGTLGRATTAARGVGRTAKELEDVKRAQQNVDAARKGLEELDAQIAEETKRIAARYEADAGDLEKVSLAPKRGQVLVEFVALGWVRES